MFINNTQKLYLILITLFLLSCSDNGDSKEGCMDESSCNYDEQALIDDGSCEGPANTFSSVLGNPCGNCPNGCGICNDEYTYTFNDDILDLLNGYGCADCHSSAGFSNAGGLDFSSYVGITSLHTNSSGVIGDCNNAQNSILINKLTTGTMKEEATWYGYDPDSLIEKLTIWLSEGAPE